MKRTDITEFLHYLRAHDPYLEVDPYQVQAWADALDPAITVDFARKYAGRHYGQPDAPRLTPGGMNAAWRRRKADKALVEIGQAEKQATPMPDWFREQRDRVLRGGAA